MTLEYFYAKIIKKIQGKAIVDSKIDYTSKVESGSQIVRSEFGRYSFCGYDCQIINCTVGAFTSISNNVVIGGASHPMDWVSMSPVFYKGRDSVKKKFSNNIRKSDLRTIVGNDVWIGESVLIKQGIKIGDGAVIGMGSIVTKDVEPYCVVAGNPAKVLKKRFNENIVELLISIKWWNFDDDKISRYAEFITDPNLFISEVIKNENIT